MKRLVVVGLMCIITLLFTGCSVEHKGMDMGQAIEVYGNDYRVIELSNVEFLIVWDNAQLVFSNNECVDYVGLHK